MIADLVAWCRAAQGHMTNAERVDFWSRLREGYCPNCGRAVAPGAPLCQCNNDE